MTKQRGAVYTVTLRGGSRPIAQGSAAACARVLRWSLERFYQTAVLSRAGGTRYRIACLAQPEAWRGEFVRSWDAMFQQDGPPDPCPSCARRVQCAQRNDASRPDEPEAACAACRAYAAGAWDRFVRRFLASLQPPNDTVWRRP